MSEFDRLIRDRRAELNARMDAALELEARGEGSVHSHDIDLLCDEMEFLHAIYTELVRIAELRAIALRWNIPTQ